MFKHVRPTGCGLLRIQQAVFHELPAGEIHILIIQRAGIKLLFRRLEVRLRAGPDSKRLGDHLSASLLQLRQAPRLLLADLLIHPQAAVSISALFSVPLLLETLVAEVRVITSQRQVGQAVQPCRMDLRCIGSQRLRPGRRQVLGHNVLNAVLIVV